MRKTILLSAIALGVTVSAPAFAQGVYIGPGGVGVDTGVRHYRGDYDRDRYDPYRDRDTYEGRSAYRDRDFRRDRGDY